MREIKQLLIIGIAILMLSCSSDDNGNSVVTLEGTWKLTAFTTSDAVDYNGDGNATTDFMAETNNCYADNTLVFKAANIVDASGSYTEIEVEIQSGTTNQLIVVTECINDNQIETYDWSQSGNDVTVANVGTGMLSGNTLTFTTPQGTLLTTIENNIEVFTLTDIVLVYTKQ